MSELTKLSDSEPNMPAISRRHLLTGSLALGAAAVGGLSLPAQAKSVRSAVAETFENDGLAHPIPYQPQLGQGKARGLVLGGGGVYLLAWMMGYFHALKRAGVDLNTADMVVGTSAGALAGTMLTSGQLWRLDAELDIFAELPKVFAMLLPPTAPNASQLRARQRAVDASDASATTIQGIGRAAMASRNPDGPGQYYDAVKHLVGQTAWPSDRLYTTANDCYTGERLVVSQAANIPVDVACAASSSLPGAMGPTWLNNRFCMDGGICQTSTHADVVAGVKRALLISLTDGGSDAVKIGLRTSGMPSTLLAVVKALEAAGTQTKLVVCGLAPGVTHVNSIVDPAWIKPLMAYGRERGLADAESMAAFWR